MFCALRASIFFLLSAIPGGLCARKHHSRAKAFPVFAPPDTSLRAVGMVMNPGGLVPSNLYNEHMQRWQAEAQTHGISLWVTVLSYWFDLPIPIRTKANVINGIADMQREGLPDGAPVYFTGHSMGAGAALSTVQELYDESVVSGMILQAGYITRDFFPPVTAGLTFTVPALTVGAELNFGRARITRMAEAFYRQNSTTHPVVMVQGMNHMQFASGYEKEDLKPEISEAEAQQKVAKLSMDWLAKELGLSSGDYLATEVSSAQRLLQPLIDAFKLEGSRSFNVPNQKGTPNNNCPRGVCPEGSQWISEAQAYMAGKDVMNFGVELQNNFADLNPFSFDDREGRKPFINGQAIQAYVMAAGSESEYTADEEPFATAELMGKFISRQNAAKTLLGRSLQPDADFCAELNAAAYQWALDNAGEATRARFQASGQTLLFDSTKYEFAGPLWVLGGMEWSEQQDGMHLKSRGLFTEPGDREIDGNHYCKLLSPAKAMEWLYVDGLKKELFAIW